MNSGRRESAFLGYWKIMHAGMHAGMALIACTAWNTFPFLRARPVFWKPLVKVHMPSHVHSTCQRKQVLNYLETGMLFDVLENRIHNAACVYVVYPWHVLVTVWIRHSKFVSENMISHTSMFPNLALQTDVWGWRCCYGNVLGDSAICACSAVAQHVFMQTCEMRAPGDWGFDSCAFRQTLHMLSSRPRMGWACFQWGGRTSRFRTSTLDEAHDHLRRIPELLFTLTHHVMKLKLHLPRDV